MKDLYGVHIPKPSFPGVEVVARTQNEPTNMFGTKYVTTRCTKILSSSNDPYISTTMFEWILTIEQLHTPIHLAMLLQQEPNWSIKPWSHGAKSTWPGPWAPPRCVLFWSSPQPFKKPTSPARKIAATWLTYWPSDPLLFWNRTWWTWNLGFGMYHVFFFYNIFWLTAPPISDASQTTNGWWWCSLHRPSVCACIVYILYNYILNTHTNIPSTSTVSIQRISSPAIDDFLFATYEYLRFFLCPNHVLKHHLQTPQSSSSDSLTLKEYPQWSIIEIITKWLANKTVPPMKRQTAKFRTSNRFSRIRSCHSTMLIECNYPQVIKNGNGNSPIDRW